MISLEHGNIPVHTKVSITTSPLLSTDGILWAEIWTLMGGATSTAILIDMRMTTGSDDENLI